MKRLALLLILLAFMPFIAGCNWIPDPATPAQADAVACDLGLCTLGEVPPAPVPPAPTPDPDGDTGSIGKEAGGIRGLIEAGTQAANKVGTAADRGDAIMRAFQTDGIVVKPAKSADMRLIPTEVAQCPGGQCPVPRAVRTPSAPVRQATSVGDGTARERRGFPIIRRLCRRCG